MWEHLKVLIILIGSYLFHCHLCFLILFWNLTWLWRSMVSLCSLWLVILRRICVYFIRNFNVICYAIQLPTFSVLIDRRFNFLILLLVFIFLSFIHSILIVMALSISANQVRHLILIDLVRPPWLPLNWVSHKFVNLVKMAAASSFFHTSLRDVTSSWVHQGLSVLQSWSRLSFVKIKRAS